MRIAGASRSLEPAARASTQSPIDAPPPHHAWQVRRATGKKVSPAAVQARAPGSKTAGPAGAGQWRPLDRARVAEGKPFRRRHHPRRRGGTRGATADTRGDRQHLVEDEI